MKEKILECKSLSDVCKLFGYPTNGVGFSKVRVILKDYDISEDIFNKKKMYEKEPKLCKYCGNIISYNKKDNDFCNSSCSASFNNNERIKNGYILTDESKKKTSLSLLEYHGKKDKEYIDKNCLCCGKTFTLINTIKKNRSNYCSNECRKEIKSRNTKNMMKERIKNGLHKGWQSRNIISYPEKFFIEVLKNNNLENEYKFNFPINKKRDLEIDEPYSYFLDFYFTEKKILLEIDGKQHEYRKEHDELRDERLKSIGIKIHRIKWKSINNEKGKEYIKNEIDKFLDFYNKN